MKKALAIIAVLLPFMAAAQYFTLTPEGWKNAEDNTLDYVVVPMEGTQAELFQKAKTAVTATYKSAKDVMSFNEPDIITVNGYTDCIFIKRMGMRFDFGMRYTMQILFKDGKIRFNVPDAYEAELKGKPGFISLRPGSTGFMGNTEYVFDKNGKLKKKDQKQQVEDYFNGLVQTIIDKMKNGASNDDDW